MGGAASLSIDDDAALRRDTARLGMWVFLASEMLFFGGLIAAYAAARWHASAGFAAASAQTDVALGTLNTALLLTSSFVIALAVESSGADRRRGTARWLGLAAALGVAFLAIKGFEWRREWAEGLFPGPGFTVHGRVVPGAEVFFAWYFVATALHALHLLIGVAGCAGFAVALRRSQPAADLAPRIHGLALYWHFVDVVWIVLYPLIYLVAPRT